MFNTDSTIYSLICYWLTLFRQIISNNFFSFQLNPTLSYFHTHPNTPLHLNVLTPLNSNLQPTDEDYILRKVRLEFCNSFIQYNRITQKVSYALYCELVKLDPRKTGGVGGLIFMMGRWRTSRVHRVI